MLTCEFCNTELVLIEVVDMLWCPHCRAFVLPKYAVKSEGGPENSPSESHEKDA